jgi:hypothetical protein
MQGCKQISKVDLKRAVWEQAARFLVPIPLDPAGSGWHCETGFLIARNWTKEVRACIIPSVSFNEEALVTQFTTLLDTSEKGHLTTHIPDLQAPLAEQRQQLKRVEVLFWFQGRTKRG